MSGGRPLHRELAPTLASFWSKSSASAGVDSFLAELSYKDGNGAGDPHVIAGEGH